jgi:hypothetical protein
MQGASQPGLKSESFSGEHPSASTIKQKDTLIFGHILVIMYNFFI